MKQVFSNKAIAMFSAVIIIVISFYLITTYLQRESAVIVAEDWQDQLEEDDSVQKNDADNSDVIEEKTIMIDLKGEVEKPGVYEAVEGERVVDLVSRAGGLTKDAAEDLVNFAMYVEDEMVIYIPKVGEEVAVDYSLSSSNSSHTHTSNGKINLNKASEKELESLPGIGPAKATAIIDFRETNGPFKATEELMLVSGIGEKTFEKLADQITVK